MKPKSCIRIPRSLATALAGLALTATSSHAALVVTENAGAELDFAGDVVSGDLAEGVVPTFGGVWDLNLASINDGLHGPSFNTDNAGALDSVAWAQGPGRTVEFILGAGDNGLGYDLTSIQSITAWNGAAFGNQAWVLEAKPVGGVYATLATVDFQPNPNNNTIPGASQVILTDDAGLLVGGVESLRFTTTAINSAAGGGFTWREIDVEGQSTVPEPSSLALLGFGGLALLRRRRRD